MIIVMMFNSRSAGDSSNDVPAVNDGDMVELEKSNILLMGPTGSGILIFVHLSNSMLNLKYSNVRYAVFLSY